MEKKIILDLCGGTGAWSKPYKDNGYDVELVTIPEKDVLTYKPPKNVYGILAAPPCNQFSFAKSTGKPRDLKKGMEVVFACLNIIAICQYKLKTPYAHKTNLKFWCLENPNGLLKMFLGKPAYQFDPWEFGHNYTKKTYLWGWFNEPIKTVFNKDLVMTDEDKKRCKINNRILPDYIRKLSSTSGKRAITPAKFAQAFFEANK
tara:strand:+ start:185 stop:793 length:609 start_codon:yes stop_codon:yes gene_type:complete